MPSPSEPDDTGEQEISGASDAPRQYAVPIEELEAGVRVPLEAQLESQSADAADDSASTWNEAERQLRLAGGA